jgi:ParB-like chromosome segregation protein Spo0J
MKILERVRSILNDVDKLDINEKIEIINQIKMLLSEHSPFNKEPVDCVLWIKNEKVHANDYNPNSVASVEMDLLEHSICHDGYTQPIVTFAVDEKYEVVDGFHRHLVGKKSEEICSRLNGYLPVVRINDENQKKEDRIASTIRHNRARGKHKIDAMSDIVLDLKRRKWTTDRICKELGMDKDEVLRLSQVRGLALMFADREFSEAWDVQEEAE